MLSESRLDNGFSNARHHGNAYWSHVIVVARVALATGRAPLVSSPSWQCRATPGSLNREVSYWSQRVRPHAQRVGSNGTVRTAVLANVFVPVAHRTFAQVACAATGTVAGGWVAAILVAHWPSRATVRHGTVLLVAHWLPPCDCSLRHRATGRTLAAPCDWYRSSRATPPRYNSPTSATGIAAAGPHPMVHVACGAFSLAGMTRTSATGIAPTGPNPTAYVARGPLYLTCLTRASATGIAPAGPHPWYMLPARPSRSDMRQCDWYRLQQDHTQWTCRPQCLRTHVPDTRECDWR